MKILKQHLKALAWLALYFVLQMMSLIVILVGKILLDKDFLVKLNYDLLAGENYKLISEISTLLIPALILESILIIILFIGYIHLTKNKNIIQKIKSNIAIKYSLIAIIANLLISIIITFIPSSIYTSKLTESTDLALNGSIGLIILGTGFLVPILEEIIFRYGIGYNLSKINEKYALIIQAIIFGLMHGNLIQGIYATFLGLMFGYVDKKENNLLPSIIMHITINLSSVCATYLPINEFLFMILVIAILGISYKLTSTKKDS